MWSLYSRHFLRHYNELNHEFDARLKKAYIPANKYLNLFTSPMLVIIAKYEYFYYFRTFVHFAMHDFFIRMGIYL